MTMCLPKCRECFLDTNVLVSAAVPRWPLRRAAKDMEVLGKLEQK